jgi:hypothetical protein
LAFNDLRDGALAELMKGRRDLTMDQAREFLVKLFPEVCLWCGGPVPNNRKVWHTCSSTCNNNLFGIVHWSIVRDKYWVAHPNCEICEAKTEEIHHKVPVKKHGLGGCVYDPKNLIALCRKCHLAEHAKLSVKVRRDSMKTPGLDERWGLLFEADITSEKKGGK